MAHYEQADASQIAELSPQEWTDSSLSAINEVKQDLPEYMEDNQRARLAEGALDLILELGYGRMTNIGFSRYMLITDDDYDSFQNHPY